MILLRIPKLFVQTYALFPY